MKTASILLTSVLVELASAFPGMAGGRREANNLARQPAAITNDRRATTNYPAWHPPQSGEVRSPCPGLNSLANHDICPRNGKGYTIPILTKCLKAGLNVGADFATVVGTAGIASNPNPALLYFDLDMLDRHNFVIEHDGSLSRADASTGNNYSFNQTIFDTVLAYYANDTDATIPTASKARFNRIQTENARDPNFSYSAIQFILSYGETSLYLSTMGDPVTGVAPVEYVRSLFEQEKLPYELGWTPPKTTTTLASLALMAGKLNLASGEQLPEGVILSEKSLRAALIGVNAATGQVVNQAAYAAAKLTGAVGGLTGLLGL